MAADADKTSTPDEPSQEGTGPAPVKVGKPPRPVTQQVGRVAMIVAGGIFALFALFNAQFVDFSWVFGETEVVKTEGEGRISGGVPLILLLLAAFALGSVVGMGLMARRQSRRAFRAGAKGAKRG